MQQDDRELLIRLDERQKAEVRRINYLLADINARLLRLEARASVSIPQLGNWGWFKIALAAGITMIVWLTTGDPRAALRAAGALSALQ